MLTEIMSKNFPAYNNVLCRSIKFTLL